MLESRFVPKCDLVSVLLTVLDVVFCFHANKSPNRSPSNPQSLTTVVLQCRNGGQTVPTMFNSMPRCHGYGADSSMSTLLMSLPLRVHRTVAPRTDSGLRLQELSTGTRSERRNVRVYRPAAPHPHKHFEINDDSVDSFADFTANTKTRRFPPTGDSHPRRGRTEHAAVIALTESGERRTSTAEADEERYANGNRNEESGGFRDVVVTPQLDHSSR
jgi:hypothetical protein